MANEKLVTRETAKKVVEGYTQELKESKITVGISKNIAPVSEESGTIQETPFILQGTGTANNTDSVDTSPVGKQLEKQGNTVCVNQIARPLTLSYWGFSNATGSFSNGVATFTASAQNGQLIHQNFTCVANHTYLLVASVKLTTGNTSVYVYNNVSGGTQSVATKNTTDWQILFIKATATQSSTSNIIIRDTRSSSWDAIQVKNVQLIDLTQWFNGDIPQDLLDNPSHWSWYQNYGNYIAYNTGTLVNCAGRYLVNTYRNQWDEEWELGQVDTSTGALVTSTSWGRTKNYINVIPNAQYYLKSPINLYMIYYDKNKNYISSYYRSAGGTFTIPSNCVYMKMTNYGWKPYNHDITISLYYATGDGYSDYYPYQEPSVYDTGTEVLRKAGNYKDTKAPDGTITRRVGTYTFTGEESWYIDGAGRLYNTWLTDLIKKPSAGNVVANILCNRYTKATANQTYAHSSDKIIGIDTDGYIYIYDSSFSTVDTFKTWLSTNNLVLFYESATPTTEQGTPFTENINIDDYGTMAWLDTDNAYVDIPQGTKLFYPAWYVGFIDSLGQRSDIDWYASNVVSSTQLSTSETQRDSVDTQLLNAIGGTLRQCLCVKESLSFENTYFVDLGNLTWTYSATTTSGVYMMKANVSNMKTTSSSASPKIVCTLYKTITGDQAYLKNIGVGLDSKNIVVYDSDYTSSSSPAAFKSAMKGVLLAYEKAS